VPLAKLADRIAVPSEFLKHAFREYGLAATVLPNIADTNLFPWRHRRQFAPRLLVTRHLEPIYNLECLLRALRIVQSRFPEAALTIAGAGSEENRLRDLVRRWGLPGVNFCGPVAHHELPSLYASHDIYVNSSNIDNFPGALVEAACCGLPIVTTRAGGIPHMIHDRKNGVLVELNDHINLAAAVVEIVKNPVLGQNLACAARQWAEQYSWSNIFPVLLDCYSVPTSATRATKREIARSEEARRREFVR
jgi:glycosyltransferase involved in cell wall biosynthesis